MPVSGVRVAFVRRSGVEIIADTLRAMSDGTGNFTLRGGSIYNGATIGDLLVSPPAPLPPFAIRDLTLRTTTVRGDGEVLGRLVVNPYLLLVGHVRDRRTLTPLPEAVVTVRRVAGGEISPAEQTFTTDFGGQFSWEPTVTRADSVEADFDITAPGYPRTFHLRRKLPLQFRDNEMAFTILPVGFGLAYVAATARRGSGDQLPVRVDWVRRSGIHTHPEEVTITPDAGGFFGLPIEPLSEGSVVGELRITPPSPIPPETTLVVLQTSDDDIAVFLGFFRYGSQVLVHAELRDAETGATLPPTTGVTMKHVGGVPLAWSNPQPGGDLLAVTDSGTITYRAPTADSGSATFDMIVRHPPPFIPDTIRGLTFPARYSDIEYQAGVFLVRRRTAQP